MKSFGIYIKNLRIKNSVTLRELASQLELDVSALSKIENDWRQFPESKLIQFANIFNRPLEEIEEEYLNTSLIQKYGHIKNFKEKISKILNETKFEHNIYQIIDEGENRLVEFKSSLRYCLKNKRPEKYIEFGVIKNIAAFLNTNGGKLIIGVDDNKKVIGLETTDYLNFVEKNKQDAFLKYIDNLIATHFGNQFSRNFEVKFIELEGVTIVMIDITSNRISPTFVKNTEKNKEEFYIRRNASAIALSMKEFYEYSKERWK